MSNPRPCSTDRCSRTAVPDSGGRCWFCACVFAAGVAEGARVAAARPNTRVNEETEKLIEKHCVGLELPRKDFIEYVVHFFNEQANY